MGARTSRTSRTSRLVGLALAVLALATAAGCSGGGDRSAVTTGATGPAPPTGGLAVDLPPGWRTVEPYQPAHITEPVAVLALASGPGVRRARTACHVGGAYAIPDEVAVVVVLEWRWMDVSSDVPFPAPAALRATDLPLHRSGLECFAGRAGATQVETAGRAFGVYLMLGAAADGRTVEQALAAIRSLRTTTVPAPAGWRVVEDPVRGVAVALPPGWTRARRTLTPLLADPLEILSVGTGPLVPQEHPGCHHMPGRALDRLGARGAFLSIQELGRFAQSIPRGFPPRRRALRLSRALPGQWACTSRSEQRTDWRFWLPLHTAAGRPAGKGVPRSRNSAPQGPGSKAEGQEVDPGAPPTTHFAPPERV